jgi:peptide/nickel transport system substrate-binding protein
MRVRGATATLVTLGLVVSAAGVLDRAASGQAPSPPVRGGTVIGSTIGDLDSLDPGITYVTSGAELSTALHRGLYLSSRDGGEIRPDLAAGPAAISPDARTVTVTIRPGVRFSPPVNREVRSEDVKYAIERGFTRAVPNGYANIYFASLEGVPQFVKGTAKEITGIQAPDPRTLVFKLSEPVGGFFAGALVMSLTSPVPREYAAPFDAVRRGAQSRYGPNQASTGPYMIERDASGKVVGYRKGRYLRLVRNPNWDGPADLRPAYADRIEINMRFPTAAAATRRILSGANTFGFGVGPPLATLRRLVRSSSPQLTVTASPGVSFIALNTTVGPFRNVNVRRAVAAALNRRELLRLAGGSVVGEIATHFLAPSVPGHQQAGGAGAIAPFLAKPGGDVALARGYMRRAGYRGGRYRGRARLIAATIRDPEVRRSNRVLARAFRALGLRVRFREFTLEVAYRKCSTPKERIAVCSNGWFADFPDAQTVLQPLFHGKAIIPENSPNSAVYDDKRVNAAIESARQVVGAEARAQAWALVDRLVTSQVPYIPVTWPKVALIKGTRLVGEPNQLYGEWDLESIGLSG